MGPYTSTANFSDIAIGVREVDTPPAALPIDGARDLDVFVGEPRLPRAHVVRGFYGEAEVLVQARWRRRCGGAVVIGGEFRQEQVEDRGAGPVAWDLAAIVR